MLYRWIDTVISWSDNKHSWEHLLHPLLSFLSRTDTVAFVESLQEVSGVISTFMETRCGQGWKILVHSPESVLLLHVDTCYQCGQLTIARLFPLWPLQGLFTYSYIEQIWNSKYVLSYEVSIVPGNKKIEKQHWMLWGRGEKKDKEGHGVLHPVQYSDSRAVLCVFTLAICVSPFPLLLLNFGHNVETDPFFLSFWTQ